MLITPTYRPDQCCIMSIDPGTSFAGVAAFWLNVYTLAIEHVSTTLLRGVQLSALQPEAAFWHGDRYGRIQGIATDVSNLLFRLQPIAVVAEDNFMSRRRPNAYGALVESVASFRAVLSQYNPTMQLDIVEAVVAKKCVGAGAKADKHQVNAAIRKIPELTNAYVGRMPIEQLVEHETDAIAIGYWRVGVLRTIASTCFTTYKRDPNTWYSHFSPAYQVG